MWRIPWISWAHSRWRLQRRWKGSKKQTLRNCSKFKVTSRLDISINWLMQQSRHDGNKLWSSSWKNIQLAKALTWLALLIVFSSTKKSMDQLPTDHHPLLQVRIQSEHSGVIGSTKSATAWHMCRRNRQSCYAVNKSDSKCYTQPLPSIEKHCIWWYSIYVYTYIYVLKTKYLASTKKKWHWDVPTFSVVPVVFNVTFTVMLMRHRPSEALVLCVKFFTSVVSGLSHWSHQ